MIADPAKVPESLRVPNSDGVNVKQPQPVADCAVDEDSVEIQPTDLAYYESKIKMTSLSPSRKPRPLKIQLAMFPKTRMSIPKLRTAVDRPMMTKMIL